MLLKIVTEYYIKALSYHFSIKLLKQWNKLSLLHLSPALSPTELYSKTKWLLLKAAEADHQDLDKVSSPHSPQVFKPKLTLPTRPSLTSNAKAHTKAARQPPVLKYLLATVAKLPEDYIDSVVPSTTPKTLLPLRLDREADTTNSKENPPALSPHLSQTPAQSVPPLISALLLALLMPPPECPLLLLIITLTL